MSQKKQFKLLPEHDEALEPYKQKWIANALATSSVAYTSDERAECIEAIRGLYEHSKPAMKAPEIAVFAPSPICGAFAAGFAAGIIWMRANPAQHVKLFGKELDEKHMIASLLASCTAADAQCGAGGDDVLQASFAALGMKVPKSKPRVKAELKEAVNNGDGFLRVCAQQASYMRNGGSQWSGSPCYIDFLINHIKVDPNVYDVDIPKYTHYMNAAKYGPRFMHPQFFVVAERPTRLKMDDRQLLHCAEGSAAEWLDGRKLFFWHGTRVPAEWILNPKGIDPSVAISWENAEERRCAAEIIGWARVLEHLGATTVDKHSSPTVGELVEVTLAGRKERFLRVLCGTGRTFAMPVPPETKTAIEGQNWIHNWPSDGPQPEFRT